MLLAQMRSNQALCLGRLAEGIGDQANVVTERRRKQQPHLGSILRTKAFLQYATDEPALMLIDFDRKGMPPSVAERVDQAGCMGRTRGGYPRSQGCGPNNEGLNERRHLQC
jgi:hypothetical protein